MHRGVDLGSCKEDAGRFVALGEARALHWQERLRLLNHLACTADGGAIGVHRTGYMLCALLPRQGPPAERRCAI